MPNRKILADVTNENITRFIGLLENAEDDARRTILQLMLMDEMGRFVENVQRNTSLRDNLSNVASKLDQHLKLIKFVPVDAAGRSETELLICNLTMAYGALAFISRSNAVRYR